MKKIYLLLLAILCIAYSNSTIAQNLVISQVYGGAGCGTAGCSIYKNDYIEIFNRSGSPVSLNGLSVQYASSTGSSWQVTSLPNFTLQPGQYFLVLEQFNNNGVNTPPPGDASGSIAMSATAGKVALVNGTTALTGTCPTTNVIDFVGYGSATNCSETSPAPAPSTSNGIFRAGGGCTDANNNSTDFSAATANARNSSTTLNPCGPVGITVTISANPPAAEPATDGSYTVTLSSAAPAEGLTINYAVSGTASNGTDYTTLSGQLTIPSGQLTGTIQLDVLDDVIIDPNETAIVTLSAGTGYSVGLPSSATLTITDNEISNLSNYSFNSCTSTLSDGFTEFSVTGAIVWGCTTFGRDPNNPPLGSAANGVQINGFSGGTNVPNVDWLISPALDLSSTNIPLLSYWSRTRFNGEPLQLKISTDYVSGDPTSPSVHWTDLNGRFPAETSDEWSFSSYINLSSFKSSNVHIAFVYTSTNDDGARWTLDDISIDNSTVAPPATLSVSTTDMQFGFVANGSTSDKTFNFTGNDITNDVSLTTGGTFLLSKDGISFSSSINYTVAEANNIPKTVFVRFGPNQNSQNFSGSITISSGSLSSTINLKGTSIDPAITLEVVNWNIEWFGSTSNGPTNDAQQEQNVRTILQNIGADLYGLVEVVDEARLANVVSTMPGYAYVISNFGSHTNPNESPAPPPDALAQAQKLAFVYKTSVFSNVTTTALLSAGINTPADVSTTSYNNWSSGRYPFMLTADVTLDGTTKNVKFILIHAKANTSPTITSYNRRKAGSDELHALLNSTYGSDNVVILGDFNDDLDQTITDGITPPTTSYDAFTTDPSNYNLLTLPLSQAGKRSTVSHDNVIDHVVISSELGNNFMPGSSNILTDVTGLVSGYSTTTSDHYPVFTRYTFSATLPVKLNYFTAEKVKESVKLRWSSSFESNSKEYIVERSANGLQFEGIGKITAKGQASTYEFLDASPLSGNNYYRLSMVDLDGKFEHTKSIRISFEKALLITIRPNPAHRIVKLILDGELSSRTVNIAVYDQQGRLLKQQTKAMTPSQPIDFEVTGISQGMYLLKVKTGDREVTEKLIIR